MADPPSQPDGTTEAPRPCVQGASANPYTWLLRALHADPSLLSPGRSSQGIADAGAYDLAATIYEQLIAAGRRDVEPDLAALCFEKGKALDAARDHGSAIDVYARAAAIYARLVNDEGRRELSDALAQAIAHKAAAMDAFYGNRAAIDTFEPMIAMYECLAEQERRRPLMKFSVAAAMFNSRVRHSLPSNRAMLARREGASTADSRLRAVLCDERAMYQRSDREMANCQRLGNLENRASSGKSAAVAQMSKANTGYIHRDAEAAAMYTRAASQTDVLANEKHRHGDESASCRTVVPVENALHGGEGKFGDHLTGSRGRKEAPVAGASRGGSAGLRSRGRAGADRQDTGPIDRRRTRRSSSGGLPGRPRDGGGQRGRGEPDYVRFSAFPPRNVRPGEMFPLEVWAYLEAQRQEVLNAISNKPKLDERRVGPIQASHGDSFTLHLVLPGFDIPQPRQTFWWTGSPANVGFAVRAPAQPCPDPCRGSIEIIKGDICIASIVFELNVSIDGDSANREAMARYIRTIFASYATEDRLEVLQWARGAFDVGVDVYLDVVSLRAGQNWEGTLLQELVSKDRFCLFWSVAASKSPWVGLEWRCAFDGRGIDYIRPVPLADPRDAPPPPELGSVLHFNDLYRMAYDYEKLRRERAARDSAQ